MQVDFGAPTVATVEAVELQGRYPGGYWGNVNRMGFEVQSAACAQDPTCNAWTAAKVAGFATFSGAANQHSNRKFTNRSSLGVRDPGIAELRSIRVV